MRLVRSLVAFAVLVLTTSIAAFSPAHAESDQAEKSAFVTFVENQISTPDRKISIGRIDGTLSSDVKIESITISDRQGVWLTIDGAHLVWSRLALLSGKLSIDLLEAQSITIARQPLPPEGFQPTASAGFTLPDLPVSIEIGKLSVPTVSLGAPIIGQPATLSVDGAISLEGGKLDTHLDIKRLDGPGGALTFKATYANDTRLLDLDLTLQENKNGLISNLLNLPGRPALAFGVKGSGLLDNFKADISLSADGKTLLSGAATIAKIDKGLNFQTNIAGGLSQLVPPTFAEILSGNASLSINATYANDGTVAIDKAAIATGVLSLNVTGALASDGFPTTLAIDGKIGSPDGKPVKLPGGNGDTVAGGRFTLGYGGGKPDWQGDFDLTDLLTPAIHVGHTVLQAHGVATNPADAAKRSLTFAVAGRADGLKSPDAALAKAIGAAVTLDIGGAWHAGSPVAIDRIAVANGNASASFKGQIADGELAGDYDIAARDLSAFADLAGQSLRGATELKAAGKVAPVSGAFDLTLDGTGTDLGVGIAKIDPLLAGRTTLSGGIARTTEGLRFIALNVANDAITAKLDGTYGRDVAVTTTTRLAEVANISPDAAGALAFDATLSGTPDKLGVKAALTSDRLMLRGKPFTAAAAHFDGTVAGSSIDGAVDVTGTLNQVAVKATARIATDADGTRRIDGLDAHAGQTSLTGSLALRPDGLVAGVVKANSPDIATVAPLFLVKASGSIAADIELTVDGASQNAAVKATAGGLKVETFSLASANVDFTGTNLLKVPSITGEIEATGVAAGSVLVKSLHATATRSGPATAFKLDAALAQGALNAEGALTPADTGFDLNLAQFSLKRPPDLSAALVSPVTVAVRNGAVTIPKTDLRIGKSGLVSVAAQISDTLSANVTIANLPLSLANAFSPGLGAAGTVSGTATLSGTTADPHAVFRMRADGVALASLRQAGVPALTVTADGQYAANVVSLDVAANGAGGIALKANGRIPLSGPGLSLAITGTSPLALANPMLAIRGARVTGVVMVDARVTGSREAPSASGSASISGATFSDPESGVGLSAISARLRFDQTRATVESASATTKGGGTIALSGSVGLNAGYPADIAVTLTNAHVSDGDLARAIVDGRLTVRGPLTGQPTLAGQIHVDRAEITIPDRLPTSSTLLDVKHRRPSAAVARTLRQAKLATGNVTKSGGRASGLVLDLTLDAPGQILVGGRGVDAELGGRLRLTGPVSNISPTGGFTLKRGELDIIGRQIAFDRGSVSFAGDFNPTIDFVATSQANTITVTFSVTGEASDPQIKLSSSPDLPQDEILAQFLFGHSIADLSGFQIATLATSVAELAGGSSSNPLSKLGKATGLGSVNLGTDSSGNPALRVGNYLGKNLHFGANLGVNSGATIDLDITKHLKARGEAGTQGEKAGIYYEREY